MSDPNRVGEPLERVVRSLGGPSAGVLGALFSRWEEIVGERLAAHARPVSVKDRTLVVAVDEAGWATQLRYLEGDLRRRLEEVTGDATVERVEVRVRPS